MARPRKKNGRTGEHRTAVTRSIKPPQYSGIDAASVSAASASDAAWFKANPRRSHRLRVALPGEFPPLPMPEGVRIVTAVRQLEPGMRLRVPFGLPACLPVEDVPEAECCAMFEMALENNGSGRDKPFTIGDIQARVHQEVSDVAH